MTDHAWVRDVPTAVLEELAEWWSEGFVIVTREDAGDAHLPSCDGSAHTPEDWTAAVCAELARRRAPTATCRSRRTAAR